MGWFEENLDIGFDGYDDWHREHCLADDLYYYVLKERAKCWEYAVDKKKKTKWPEEESLNIGKWLIFTDKNNIKEKWKIIKKATEKGQLGFNSKCAKGPNPNSDNKETRVICVYTYDYEDNEDVFKVREELERLGFTQVLYYKTDQMTRDGQSGSIYEG